MAAKPRKPAVKHWGQHFLHDGNIIEKILTAIDPKSDEHFVEIGPGQGALTRPILQRSARLDAIEIDQDLAKALTQELADPRFHIHRADALKFDFSTLSDGDKPMRMCGNLPYNISSPLLFHLLKQPRLFRDMHVMLQKEVVDRMAAEPGSRTYGRLTVALKARCHVDKLFTIRPGSFVPAPKVDSAFVRLTPDKSLRNRIQDESFFNELIRQAFSMRRKTLANALRGIVDVEIIKQLDIDSGLRPERVTVEQFITLANAGRA